MNMTKGPAHKADVPKSPDFWARLKALHFAPGPFFRFLYHTVIST